VTAIDSDAIRTALDGLLGALELDPVGDDRFRAGCEPDRFGRVFGGQTLAQALMAASTTVTGMQPQSFHAYFVAAGAAGDPVDLAVGRLQDGRTLAARHVSISQRGRPLLTMIASFHAGPAEPVLGDACPPAPPAEQWPTLQDWARQAPPEVRPHARVWIDRPPPIELRIGEPPTFLGGAQSSTARSHWMRARRSIGDDRHLHAVLLAYASDFLLLDMAFRSHPEPYTPATLTGFSVGHSLWFHRPVRFDRWHLHTQHTLALTGDRGLVHGAIHDDDGHLVATAVQEVLVQQH
jgi:acyl-CoA thioesterase-2